MAEIKLRGSEVILHYGKMVVPDFRFVTPKMKQMYQNLTLYFLAHQPDCTEEKRKSLQQRCAWDFRKSLAICGELGVGKSVAFKTMNKYFHAFREVHAKRDIERQVKDPQVGEVRVMEMYGYEMKESLYINDVGTEDIVNSYGNVSNVVGNLLLDRYDLWQDKGIKTHITTNLDKSLYLKRYGPRNMDRFEEMFQYVEWDGISLRKSEREEL